MATDTTGNYCPTHDKHFGKLEQCGECRRARSSGIATSSPKADTSTRRVHAARYRLNEIACWDAFKQALSDDPNIAAKMSAESMKWARLATEVEGQLLELEHDQWLVEQKRLLGGGN